MNTNAGLAQDFGVVGCPDTCERPHLHENAARRLLALGIPREILQEVLEFELTTHGPASTSQSLTSSGRKNLRGYGASDQEIRQIEGMGNRDKTPVRMDYYARERQRVAGYRERLDPEVKRARDRENSRKYRQRKRGESDENAGGSD